MQDKKALTVWFSSLIKLNQRGIQTLYIIWKLSVNQVGKGVCSQLLYTNRTEHFSFHSNFMSVLYTYLTLNWTSREEYDAVGNNPGLAGECIRLC